MRGLRDRMMALALAVLMIVQILPAGAAADDIFAGWQEAVSDIHETAVYHTVHFEAGEETLPIVFVADGALISELPDAPEQPDQRFIGWYADGQKLTGQTPITADVTAQAVYTAVDSALNAKKTNADYTYNDSGAYAAISVFGYHKKNQKPSAHANSSVAGDSARTVLEAWTVDSIKNNTDLTVEAVITALPALNENETLAVYTVIDDQLVALVREGLAIGDRVAFDLQFKGAKGIAIVKETEAPVQLVDDGALWANEDLYLTGKIPGNGIVAATPVTVAIDGEEVVAAYDIKIYANANQQRKGKTWQPADKKVQVHFYNEAFGSDQLNVYHMETETSQAELVESVAASEGWITFDAESFSVYAVTKSIEKTVSIDGASYKITVNYDGRAGIPDGAELAVSELAGEDYLTETAAALHWTEDDTVFYTKFLDISIVKDGQNIEPRTPVEVIVELLDADDAAETLEVVHFGENGAEKVESTVADGVVTFTTDSFSPFGFGSILRTLLKWTSDAVTYSLQGLSSLLRPVYTAVDITLEEGLQAINAYTVSTDSLLGSLINLWVKISVDMRLGSREELAVYSLKNGEISGILAEETDAGDLTVSLEDGDGFALVLDSGYRRKQFETGDITLDGMMPKAAEAEITSADPEIPDEELLAAYEISIDENGTEYQPDEDHPVNVSISSPGIAGAEELRVWHILDDGTREEITDFAVEGDTVSFAAEGFSVYAVTQTILTQNLVASDGNEYAIEVIYHNTSGIPMTGTELLVSEMLDTDDGYDAFVENTAEKLGAKIENLDFARVFDIKIVDQDDHDIVYEPLGDVDVNIRLIGEALDSYENVGVLHFVEDAGEDSYAIYEMETAVNGESVEFTTESFSVYVVAGYSLEKVIEASDGNTYRITLTYERDAELPEGAALDVVELDGEAYADYVGRTAVAMEAAGFDYARVFDISIVDSLGEKHQPSVPVQVSIELLDADPAAEAFSVMHFDEIVEQGEQVAAETEGNVVSFSASGFSAYAIVKGPSDIPLNWTKITSVDDLIKYGKEEGLYIGHTGGYYFKNTLINDPSRPGIAKTSAPASSFPKEEAAKYYFEQVEETADQVYVYCFDENGNRQYVVNNGNNSLLFGTEENKTAFTVTVGNGKFKFYNGAWYWNQQGGASGNRFSATNNAGDGGNSMYIWRNLNTDSDPYGIDGKSYGLMNWAGSAVGRAMMASAADDGSLKALPLTVMTKKNNYNDHLFVQNDSEITMWTFEWDTNDYYYLKGTAADGTEKYLKITNAGLSMVDKADAGKIRVVPGTGTHAGQVCLKSDNNTALTYMGSVDDGFKTGGAVGNEWLYLVDRSELNANYFLTHSADKVSVSDPGVTNGSQVIVYTRTWNEETLKYEFYAIDHDGTLLRVYESGDSIEWTGPQLNTLLWSFVEYYWEGTNEPNYYYELYNQYSEKFIAPQGNGQVLSDDTIGINMNGRRNGYYYSGIVAWDSENYAYAGLKVVQDGKGGKKIVSCPLSEADDFYFATVRDLPTDDTLNFVPTVDHTQYGITMKIVNFGQPIGRYNNTTTTKEQHEVLGDSYYVQYQGVPGLLSTDLKDNGYPIANKTSKSLAELYKNATKVNHLFIASTYSGSGYFEFDSAQNFASLVGTDGTNFKVYQEIGTMDNENKNSLKHGQFMPYNDLKAGVFASVNAKNQFDAVLKALPNTDPRKYEQMYLVQNPDYYFGVELEASFTQTPNGLDAWGHDIIYEFTGDDDFWLYVDGELVIDLGGIHSALPGSVNFRTGEVSVKGEKTTLRALYEANYRKRNPKATPDEVAQFLSLYFEEGSSIFKDYTTHTMRIFYMERGAGASNLHMRFNLASVKPGTVELTKKLDGVDRSESAFAEFPYQVWYNTSENTEKFVLLEQDSLNIRAYYKDTVTPVKYKDELPIDGHIYHNVFMLKPGETAVFSFPDDVNQYYIVECGVNTEVYDNVTANNQPIAGKTAGDHRADYAIDPQATNARSTVNYVNHVHPDALRTLEIRKKLFKEDGTTPINATKDQTAFSFRLYLGTEFAESLEPANMYTYHIKDPSGYYCSWDSTRKIFVSIEKDDYSTLSDAEKASVSFTTSMNGSIGNIPADYTVEVRNLLAGTQYKVEERDYEIPDGYSLQKYVLFDDQADTDGNESPEEPVQGVIVAGKDPRVDVCNLKGWGLRVNKRWADANYMSDRDPTYFAVFTKAGDTLTLLPGSVRRLERTQTTLYWYYLRLPGQSTVFDDYQIYEVTLSGEVDVDSGGVVSGYEKVTPILHEGEVTLKGKQLGESEYDDFTYNVLYARGELLPDSNVRVDTVTNDRPGIILKKTLWNGTRPLGGAEFTLKDKAGHMIGTFTSNAEDGVITTAFLRENVEYTLTETKTPQGYHGLESAMKLTLKEGIVSIKGVDQENYELDQGDGKTLTLIIKNRPYDLKVVKIDGNTKKTLPNVSFALHQEKTTGSTTAYNETPLYSKLISDKNGVVPNLNNMLPSGNYQLRELNFPKGYRKLDDHVYFSISATGQVTLGKRPDGVELEEEADGDTLVYILTIPNYSTGKLTIMKTVTGEMGDRDQPFNFTLKGIEGETERADYNAVKTDKSGKTQYSTISIDGSFTLADSEKIEITLPLNKKITIIEDSGNYSATWKYNGETMKGSTAAVTLAGDAVLTFTNDLKAVAPTGFRDTVAPYLLMGMMGLALLSLLRRRKGGGADAAR